MNKDIEKIIYNEQDIKKLVKNIANRINKDYQGKDLVVIGMLKGATPFMMDLIREIEFPVKIDFMQISSYEGSKSGTVVFKKDIEINVIDKDVLIIDDIVDTGITMNEVMNLFKTRHVKSIQACCLLDKPYHRQIEFDPKYIGTTVPDGFIVGYGLDYNEMYRNLPYIGILKKSIYEN